MASSSRAQQHIRCWKQHRCVGCGALYRYIFDRQIVETGMTLQGATQAIQKYMQESIQKYMQETLVNEVDP